MKVGFFDSIQLFLFSILLTAAMRMKYPLPLPDLRPGIPSTAGCRGESERKTLHCAPSVNLLYNITITIYIAHLSQRVSSLNLAQCGHLNLQLELYL